MATSKLSISKLCSIGIAIFTILLSQATVISADTSKSAGLNQNTSPNTVQSKEFPERVYNDVTELMTPIVLENGLTVQFENVQDGMISSGSNEGGVKKAPVVSLNHQRIWALASDLPKQNDSEPISLTFTQTNSGDTLFACNLQSVTEDADSKVILIGIHPNGDMFLHNIWSGSAYTIRFTGTESWEIARYLGVDLNRQTSSQTTCLNWSVERYTVTSAYSMQKVDTYQQVQTFARKSGQQTVDTQVDRYNPWGDRARMQTEEQPMKTGKSVNNVEEARKLLLYIIAAEGLQTTSVTYTSTDHYGNYYFDAWYRNFPHNVREVTKDGYVVEDED